MTRVPLARPTKCELTIGDVLAVLVEEPLVYDLQPVPGVQIRWKSTSEPVA